MALPGNDTARARLSEPPGRGSGRTQLRQRLRKAERDNERLRQQNEQLHEQNEQLQRQVEESQEELGDKDKAIADRDKRIADLERQLAVRKRNSTNSSKPPSSDGLAGAQRRRHSPRKKSGRKPGGQPGHMGHNRQPVENPDRVEEIWPQQCQHCGTVLPQEAEERQTVGDIVRRQIVDLPEVIVGMVMVSVMIVLRFWLLQGAAELAAAAPLPRGERGVSKGRRKTRKIVWLFG